MHHKAFLINTPTKILNKNYSDYKNIPMEISTRSIFAKTFETNELENLVKELKNKKDNFNNSPTSLEDENIKKKVKEIFYI